MERVHEILLEWMPLTCGWLVRENRKGLLMLRIKRQSFIWFVVSPSTLSASKKNTGRERETWCNKSVIGNDNIHGIK